MIAYYYDPDSYALFMVWFSSYNVHSIEAFMLHYRLLTLAGRINA